MTCAIHRYIALEISNRQGFPPQQLRTKPQVYHTQQTQTKTILQHVHHYQDVSHSIHLLPRYDYPHYSHVGNFRPLCLPGHPGQARDSCFARSGMPTRALRVTILTVRTQTESGEMFLDSESVRQLRHNMTVLYSSYPSVVFLVVALCLLLVLTMPGLALYMTVKPLLCDVEKAVGSMGMDVSNGRVAEEKTG
jgi:hypothetical protein